jgi:transglutaminase-like putative cysteine protease
MRSQARERGGTVSRLRIVHTSTFRYAAPVVASYNEARITPLTRTGQTVLSSHVDIQPCTWQTTYRDYWGTAVTAFEVLTPHQTLVITAVHVVQVDDPAPGRSSADWDELRAPALRDRLAEHLADTASTQVPPDLAELARATAAGLGPADAAEAVCRAVRERMEYIPGVTTVHTPATEAWAVRKGVCQDITHLALGALHSIGMPARYVSGYLDSREVPGEGGTVTGESHAWVEYWAGGWRPFDPTNLWPVGGHHVVLARGRAYEDVPPLRGIYAGLGSQELEVTVEITPEA